MNCLCCGKSLKEPLPASGWHPACIRRFFGTTTFPAIELTDETLILLTDESVQRGYTVPGIQKKLPLHLSAGNSPRLTPADYPTEYILKPQVANFQSLPEAEHLIMQMAESAGLSVVPHALVRLKDGYAYLTRRVDRIRTLGDGSMQMLAMEDFCQLDLRLTQDKYRGSYERCVRVIKQYSARPGLDLSELFMRLVFCFLTGNSDMYLKNFSLIETAPESSNYVLSPAYDLLPVNILLPEDKEEFALTMNGKKTNLHRDDFLLFAENAGISRKAADAMIRKLLSFVSKWEALCESSLLPPDMKQALIVLIHARVERIT
ncbi:MAG: HipA domain-containing protein [Clostridia bacterium]|nr:HipA domain-containing protein [Clostridia bacterium]